MSRLQSYRSRIPTHIIKILDVSSRITLFLVGQNGPLSFIFKDRLQNKYKTTIGAQIKCSCSPNKHDHCIHSLYVLLRIFKVSVQNAIMWQASYIDSQLSDLIQGKFSVVQSRQRVVLPTFDFEQQVSNDVLPSDFYSKKQIKAKYCTQRAKVVAMPIQLDSVCPICQQVMASNMCLSFCNSSCGNNYHLQCLKVWVSHKKNQQSKVTCPMCRQQFPPHIFQQLKVQELQFKKKQVSKKMHKHDCHSCGLQNVDKNVHKCILCEVYQLCQACYMGNKHLKHPFMKRNETGEWQPAEERRAGQIKINQFIDGKRQQSKNKEILQKLRYAKSSPSSLLDFICGSYPYVSKYISQNIDPYRKLNIQPESMQCSKCCSKRMIFLRRLPCGHFMDHQCLKQNIRKGIMYCQKDGDKIVKGYENLLQKQKQTEYEQKRVQWQVQEQQFSAHKMQKMLQQEQGVQNQRQMMQMVRQIARRNESNRQYQNISRVENNRRQSLNTQNQSNTHNIRRVIMSEQSRINRMRQQNQRKAQSQFRIGSLLNRRQNSKQNIALNVLLNDNLVSEQVTNRQPQIKNVKRRTSLSMNPQNDLINNYASRINKIKNQPAINQLPSLVNAAINRGSRINSMALNGNNMFLFNN